MIKDIDTSFSNLNKKYNIVIDHVSEVNGFADSVRHLDAFYNIATTLQLKWVLPVFKNPRSSISGVLPYDITGLSDFLEHHCSSSRVLISGQNVTHINVDFNELISGVRDAQKGSLLIKDLSQKELYSRIKLGLIEAIERNELEHKPNTQIATLFKSISQLFPTNKSLPVIHFRMFINRLPIITKFSDVDKFFSSFSEFNTREEAVEDREAGLNIVIHLRKGDTTVFPLPDGRFVASWGDYRKEDNRKAFPEIIERVSDSVYLHCDIEPYLALIKKASEISSDKIYLSFLCDGFERGLNRVQEHKDHVGLSSVEMEYIKKWVATEENRLKQLVSDSIGNGITAVDIIWGESDELFAQSFQSIQAANVLLLSTGGFARSIFSYFNNVSNAVAIGPCAEETATSDIRVLSHALDNMKISG